MSDLKRVARIPICKKCYHPIMSHYWSLVPLGTPIDQIDYMSTMLCDEIIYQPIVDLKEIKCDCKQLVCNNTIEIMELFDVS